MSALGRLIAYEIAYQKLLNRGGYRVSRAWCMGSVAFLIAAG